MANKTSWVLSSWSTLFAQIPVFVYRDKKVKIVLNKIIKHIHCSWHSLIFWLQLSRIPAYLEVKIWSLLKHEILTTSDKILLKRGERAMEQFLLFPQCVQYISNIRSQITYSFVKCGWLIYVFPNSANLICHGTDISKYFRVSLWLRANANESRLYLQFVFCLAKTDPTVFVTGSKWKSKTLRLK